MHYKPDLILYSSCGNIGDKLAADEQEHDDQRNNSQQCTRDNHRVVRIVQSV